MIDDIFAFNCGFPDAPTKFSPEFEEAARKVRESLPTPATRMGPASSFELAAQRDEFARRLEAKRLREIRRELDPAFRKADDAARARAAAREAAERQAAEPRVLEKGGDRRRASIKSWVAGQLALQKTAEELIAHAEQRDQETANLIRAVCAELEAV